MSLPGLGTMVRYHYSTGVDLPAVVVVTETNWNSDLTTFYGNTGPGAGEVFLFVWQDPSQLVYNVSEGTSVGFASGGM